MNDFDVAIAGAGAAGLTAAVYTGRKALSTAVISPEVGGQTALSNHIENYPGVNAMPGVELMEQFRAGAVKFGAQIISARLTGFERTGKHFTLRLADGQQMTARALILTHGKVHRKLGVPGEDKFFGRGVSTCATCDGPLFKGKTVAIVGGGNAAVEAALELAVIAKRVYLIHRSAAFRADEISVAKLKTTPVELLLNTQVVEIKGDGFITGAAVRSADGTTRELPLQGIFIEIGWETDQALLDGKFRTNAADEIITDDRQRTSVPGVFAAGDITAVAYKQTVIAAGDGAVAALEAHRYLTSPGYRWDK